MGLFSRFRQREKEEEDIFRREENPDLFDAVKAELEKLFDSGYIDENGRKHRTGVEFKDAIREEYLKACTQLDLTHFPAPIKSLEGIQHLSNLEVLYCNAPREYKIPNVFQNEVQNMSESDYEKNAQRFYQGKQVRDLTPLYYCKKIRHLQLDNQDSITEIDLGQFPKLQKLSMQRCSNLTSVTGMKYLENFDRIFTHSLDAEFCEFDFSGSQKLAYVDDVISIICKSYEYPNRVRFDKPVFRFPVETYIRLANTSEVGMRLREYSQFLRRYGCDDSINWVENSEFMARSGLNTRQVEIMKQRLDAITDTVCVRGEPPLQSLYNVYQWIATNVQYDYVSSYQEGVLRTVPATSYIYDNWCNYEFNTLSSFDEYQELIEKRIQDGKLNNDDLLDEISHNYGSIRSAYLTLFNKKAVCAGMSNLFNAFAANLGLDVESCYCHVRDEKDERSYGNLVDHQISIVKFEIAGEGAYPYYFDVTNDLGGGLFLHFAMNKEEVLSYTELGVREFASANGLSLQDGHHELNNASWLNRITDEEKEKLLGYYGNEYNEARDREQEIRNSQIFISKHGKLDMNQYAAERGMPLVVETQGAENNASSNHAPNRNNTNLSNNANIMGEQSNSQHANEQKVNEQQMER